METYYIVKSLNGEQRNEGLVEGQALALTRQGGSYFYEYDHPTLGRREVVFYPNQLDIVLPQDWHVVYDFRVEVMANKRGKQFINAYTATADSVDMAKREALTKVPSIHKDPTIKSVVAVDVISVVTPSRVIYALSGNFVEDSIPVLLNKINVKR